MRGVRPPRLRWVDAVVEVTKAAWYLFLRKSHFVEPVFAGTGPRPGVGRGNAHVLGQARQRPAEYPRFTSEDSVLRALRQRAASELFEWLGLEQVPKGYWTLLERVGDPSKALIAFISSNRFDPVLVRRRDSQELAAFRNFVHFLCQVEESTDALSARQLNLLDRHTHYGEHALVRSLLELFVTLNEAANLFTRSPGPYRLAAFAMHARRVATFRASAAAADMDEAKRLLEASRRYVRLTSRFRHAVDRKERIEAAARDWWDTASRHDQALLVGSLSDLAQIQSNLMDGSDSDVQEELEDFETRLEGLATLLDELAKRARDAAAARQAARERKRREKQARRQEEARRQREQRKKEKEQRARSSFKGREVHGLSRDELLSIFGFPPGASPELSTLRRAFIRKANKTQPVIGEPDYRERNDQYRFFKDAYKRLKIVLG